jgi:hypothetical protein
MNYIKRFNESFSYQEELQEFCESNLAYLLDEGMKVSIHNIESYNWNTAARRYVVSQRLSVVLSFGKGNRNTGGMRWDDIKDYIIPFLIRLKKEYQVLPYQEKNDDELQFKVEITSSRIDYITCKIDDVIKSNIDFLFKKARLQLYDVNYLTFYVKDNIEK